jgi:hypothetical protein
MRATDIIEKGDTIATIYGYMVVTGYNGSGLVSVEDFEFDENGNAFKTEIDSLTYSDIEKRMREHDGHNHKVRYEELEED